MAKIEEIQRKVNGSEPLPNPLELYYQFDNCITKLKSFGITNIQQHIFQSTYISEKTLQLNNEIEHINSKYITAVNIEERRMLARNIIEINNITIASKSKI